MTDAEAGRMRDFLGYGRRPPDPRWPNGAHLAVNFVINYEEGGEYSIPDGDPASEAALTEGATASVEIATKIFWAFGYNQVESYLTTLDPKRIEFDPKATLRRNLPL